MEPTITVGLFDDHPVVIDAVVSALKAHPQIIDLSFALSSKDQLLEATSTQVPDVLVLDIISEEVKALELFEHFREKYPDLPLIAYTSLSSPALVENLLFIGVKGYVNKRQPTDDLLQAIFLTAEGHISVPADYKYLTSKYAIRNNTLLSSREIEVVNLIAKEHSSAEIAEMLNLSLNTIENHRKRIFIKLNVKNVVGMIMAASSLAYIQEKK